MKQWGIVALGLLAIAIVAFWWSSPTVEEDRSTATNAPAPSGAVEQPQPAMERTGYDVEVAASVESVALPTEKSVVASIPRISGRVVLENGAPPPRGTRVRAYELSVIERPDIEWLLEGQETEADGSYSLGESAGFRGQVFAYAEGYNYSHSRMFTLGNRHLAGVDIVMDPGVTVGGVVLSPYGGGVAGAIVRVQSATGNFRFDMHSTFEAFTETNADGVFLFRGVPPGFVGIMAAAVDFSPSDKHQQYVDRDESAYGIKLTLAPPVGQASSGLAGKVVDEEEQPIAGAVVSLTRIWTEPPAEYVTDSSGRFVHPGPDVERRDIQASHRDYYISLLDFVENPGEVLIRMKRKPPKVSFIGKLVDSETGEPILDARYTILRARAHLSMWQVKDSPFNGTGQEWLNAANGLILLEDIAYDENVSFWIEAPGYQWLVRSPDFWREETPELLEEEIGMHLKARVTGRLVDEATGNPLGQIPVRFDQSELTGVWHDVLPPTLTGRDGRFLIEGIATATRFPHRSDVYGLGPFLIIDPPPPHAMIRKELRGDVLPKAGETIDLEDMTVSAGRTIRITATDNGHPQAGVGLMLTGPNDLFGPVYTDGAGVAIFTRVSETWLMSVDLADAPDTFTFRDNREKEMDILLPLGSASLTLMPPRGVEFPRVQLTHLSTHGENVGIVASRNLNHFSSSPGPYQFTHLPAGEWRVRYDRGTRDATPHEEVIVLRPNQRRVIRVDF